MAGFTDAGLCAYATSCSRKWPAPISDTSRHRRDAAGERCGCALVRMVQQLHVRGDKRRGQVEYRCTFDIDILCLILTLLVFLGHGPRASRRDVFMVAVHKEVGNLCLSCRLGNLETAVAHDATNFCLQ